MARGGRRVAQGGRPHELGRGAWLGCAVGRFAEALLLSQTPKGQRSPHVRRNAARRKVSRRRRSKNAPKEGGDGNGIDALPDEVLQHVLSFLTAQEAVRTCVLARRWRHLWRSMPVLRVAAHGWLDQLGVKKLNKFVSYLLLLRDPSALLDVCDVKICAFDQDGDAPQVDLLVVCALFLKARILRVELASFDNCIDLPDVHIISQHLTRFELTHVCLGLDGLDLSSCPSLKYLRMRGCYIFSVKISSQSLEELTIVNCIFYKHFRTQISCQSLIRLQLTDFKGATPVLESMLSLANAVVRFHGSADVCGKEEFRGFCSTIWCHNCGTLSTDSYNMQCVLLKGLSEAESLELVAEPGAFIFKKDLMWCPLFSKLKTLLLNEWCVATDFCALVYFLQHTPVLEKLILQLSKAPENWVEATIHQTRHLHLRNFKSKFSVMSWIRGFTKLLGF